LRLASFPPLDHRERSTIMIYKTRPIRLQRRNVLPYQIQYLVRMRVLSNTRRGVVCSLTAAQAPSNVARPITRPPVSHFSSTKAICSSDDKAHDCFGLAAGLTIRQQWVNEFPATLAGKTPHPGGFICLGWRRQTSNSWVSSIQSLVEIPCRQVNIEVASICPLALH
jgi:hypothetical protein